MSASWEMALADIEAAGQQDVMSAGVGQPDGRSDLAVALGHLFAGGDIRRKSWGQHSYVTTVFTDFPSGKAHSFRGGMKARQDAECQ